MKISIYLHTTRFTQVIVPNLIIQMEMEQAE